MSVVREYIFSILFSYCATVDPFLGTVIVVGDVTVESKEYNLLKLNDTKDTLLLNNKQRVYIFLELLF